MGGQMENTRIIDCTKAEELYFESSDKALDNTERDALRAHIASCEKCRHSLSEWEKLRSALREPGLKVAAPPDFTAGVMARIAEVAPQANPVKAGKISRLIACFSGARGRGIAAAAVIIALVTGSLSLATKPPGTKVASNGSGQKKIVQEERSQKGAVASPEQAAAEKNSGLSHTAPTTPAQPAASGKSTEKTPTSATKGETQVATGNPSGPGGSSGKVFLNKTRVITTTMLKIRVSDVEQARSTVIALARSAGAYVQSEYTTQTNGHQDIILRLTVPNAEAQSFVTSLTGLGALISPPEVSREDITASFASTLREYQALKAEQATAPAEERERLNSQIAFLENQLQSWDEESEKEVVIVLLEEA